MNKQGKPLWRCGITFLLFIGISAVVQAVWVTMEVADFGSPRPSGIDTVVGLALSSSLYCNLRHHIKFGGE